MVLLGPTHTPSFSRTKTLHPNLRAHFRSGLLPVMTSYGDRGPVYFVGARLRSHTAYKTASAQNDCGNPLASSIAQAWPPMASFKRVVAPLPWISMLALCAFIVGANLRDWRRDSPASFVFWSHSHATFVSASRCVS
jgi:hypothetical protein